MGPSNLLELLERAAASPKGTGVTAYLPGNVKEPVQRLSYNDLLQLASADVLCSITYLAPLRLPSFSYTLIII